MTKKILCYYCELEQLESYTAEERTLSIKDKQQLIKLSNPFQYHLGHPICSDCEAKIAVVLKDLIKK